MARLASRKEGEPAAGDVRLIGVCQVQRDSAGNLFHISDGIVWEVAAGTGPSFGVPMTAGDFYQVASNGEQYSSANGVPAASTAMTPGGFALDAHGNLVINNLVRVIAAKNGTFYGRAMKAGFISGRERHRGLHR